MSLFVQIPRNEETILRVGEYRRRLNVLKGSGTNVQRRMRRGGLAGYEPPLQATLLALADQNHRRLVFFDVGAHIGLFSALLAAVFQRLGMQAVGFEPTPSTFARAVRLRDRNKLTYMLFPFAISDAVGETKLFLSTTAETSNSLNARFRPGSTAVKVRCETIDSMVAMGAPAPSLIKIDVETFEPQVIRGAMATISAHRPWITCELLRGEDDGRLASALGGLEAEGYVFHKITPATPWPTMTRAEVMANRSSAAGSRDWLAAPKPLPHAFYRRFSTWLGALRDCDAGSNVEAATDEERRELERQAWTLAPPPPEPQKAGVGP